MKCDEVITCGPEDQNSQLCAQASTILIQTDLAGKVRIRKIRELHSVDSRKMHQVA